MVPQRDENGAGPGPGQTDPFARAVEGRELPRCANFINRTLHLPRCASLRASLRERRWPFSSCSQRPAMTTLI